MTSSFRKRVTMKVISLFLYLPWMTESWLSIGQPETRKIAKQVLFSTPFELEYFDDPENPFSEEATPLASPAGTKLVLGLNKYSHDTSICAANAKTGEVLFAMSKERLTRKKHDAGNVATLVETCLECLDLDLDSIEKVVMNNHHHRILPLEKELEHMEWESGLGINGGAESGYDDEENLLSNIERIELSHHLAHAYSTATQSPFNSGLVVVMDGMGETYRTMLRAATTKDPSYVSDLSFGEDSFTCIPSNLKEESQISYFDWREAESVYVFEKKGTSMSLRPIFKRFTPERSPPTLYNHGFENMDSVGALYSRASSHIFGDWNACGKVMGLAPWISNSWETDDQEQISPKVEERKILWGSLHSEEKDKAFGQDKTVMMGEPLIARMDPGLFDSKGNMIPKRRYDFDEDGEEERSSSSSSSPSSQSSARNTIVDDDIGEVDVEIQNETEEKEEEVPKVPTRIALDAISLAHRIQIDLETVVIDFVKHFKETTGEDNLCIAGGVGLNSVLNGRLSRELGFKKTFISPYPGDDGIAVGCCAYGLFGNKELDDAANDGSEANDKKYDPPVWGAPLSPYLGPEPIEAAMKGAIETAAPWLEVEAIRDEDSRIEAVANEIESGGVVAWYTGRSEMGPRALGHRSILADPRKKGLVRFINQFVKKRETFRPFAPSVLVEHVSDWFEIDNDGGVNVPDMDVSPYMSITAMVKDEKRSRIPAVTHVDGSSRLQTVSAKAEPLYYKLIKKFYELTDVPMVLNTSFNTLPGEPIVESPSDAIRSFLCSMDSIEMLVMGDYVIKRRTPDIRALLGQTVAKSPEQYTEPRRPKRTGPATFETKFEAPKGPIEEETVETKTRVRMPSRPMHHDKAEWVLLLDELEGELLSICDGTVTMNEILAQFTAREGEVEMDEVRMEETQLLLQNIVHRLVRLYEETLVSW